MIEKQLVRLGKRIYPIFIGSGLLDKVGDYAKGLGDSCFIISQAEIFSLYGGQLESSFKKSGISTRAFLIKGGEKYKEWDELRNIFKGLIEFDSGAYKRLFIANLGGGIVGDVGGFIAAIYKRGISYINIPTIMNKPYPCFIFKISMSNPSINTIPLATMIGGSEIRKP